MGIKKGSARRRAKIKHQAHQHAPSRRRGIDSDRYDGCRPGRSRASAPRRTSMEDPTSRYTTPEPAATPAHAAATRAGSRRRRPPGTPPPGPTPDRPAQPDARHSPTPAGAACLAPAAGRSRAHRLAGLRRDHPARRAVVLRQPDARPGHAGHRVGPALASPPDRARRLDRLRRDEAEPLGDGRAQPRARPGARATDRRRTAPGWPIGAAGSPACTPRSARWPPRIRRSRWPTGEPSASCSTASTRSPRSRPTRAPRSRPAISSTTRASASR